MIVDPTCNENVEVSWVFGQKSIKNDFAIIKVVIVK